MSHRPPRAPAPTALRSPRPAHAQQGGAAGKAAPGVTPSPAWVRAPRPAPPQPPGRGGARVGAGGPEALSSPPPRPRAVRGAPAAYPSAGGGQAPGRGSSSVRWTPCARRGGRPVSCGCCSSSAAAAAPRRPVAPRPARRRLRAAVGCGRRALSSRTRHRQRPCPGADIRWRGAGRPGRRSHWAPRAPGAGQVRGGPGEGRARAAADCPSRRAPRRLPPPARCILGRGAPPGPACGPHRRGEPAAHAWWALPPSLFPAAAAGESARSALQRRAARGRCPGDVWGRTQPGAGGRRQPGMSGRALGRCRSRPRPSLAAPGALGLGRRPPGLRRARGSYPLTTPEGRAQAAVTFEPHIFLP